MQRKQKQFLRATALKFYRVSIMAHRMQQKQFSRKEILHMAHTIYDIEEHNVVLCRLSSGLDVRFNRPRWGRLLH